MIKNDYFKMQTQPLNMVVLPETEWQILQENLKEIKSLVINRNAGELNAEWIESTVARDMLGVSRSTWQNYRDQRRIPFSQFGRKIYVRRADLEAFISTSECPPVKLNILNLSLTKITHSKAVNQSLMVK